MDTAKDCSLTGTFEYKGYQADFEYDEHEHHYYGMAVVPKSLVTFQADTLEEARREFELSIDAYLRWYEAVSPR